MDDKGRAVQAMFGSIAGGYDLTNDLISLGQHRWWKNRAISLSRVSSGQRALDLCTGTGDLAFRLANVVGASGEVVGIDFCEPMLKIARERNASLRLPVRFLHASAEELPFENEHFDSCTVAFGLRNVSDIPAVLREAHRVLRPGGTFVSLDCSTPQQPLFRALFGFFFSQVAPVIGGLSNHSLEAYRYLPASVAAFPQRREMCRRLLDAGFQSAAYCSLAGGSVAIHLAEKAV